MVREELQPSGADATFLFSPTALAGFLLGGKDFALHVSGAEQEALPRNAKEQEATGTGGSCHRY